MAGNRSARMRPGVFTFPLEFAAIRGAAARLPRHPVRRKHLPVQAGVPRLLLHQRAAGRAGAGPVLETRGQPLRPRTERPQGRRGGGSEASEGYFLLDLFRKVIFADRDLVKRYTNPASARVQVRRLLRRHRPAGRRAGRLELGLHGQRQLVANVQADLDKVMQDAAKAHRPAVAPGSARHPAGPHRTTGQLPPGPAAGRCRFGLYQGDTLERKLRDEYFAGVREVMVEPVAGAAGSLAGRSERACRHCARPDVAAAAAPALEARASPTRKSRRRTWRTPTTPSRPT